MTVFNSDFVVDIMSTDTRALLLSKLKRDFLQTGTRSGSKKTMDRLKDFDTGQGEIGVGREEEGKGRARQAREAKRYRLGG